MGFAVGYALRSFVRLALVALGFFFLALFGLQYAGIIEVRWALVAEKYHDVSDEIQSNAPGSGRPSPLSSPLEHPPPWD